MSFTMFFSDYFVVKTIHEISKILKAMRRGEVRRLIIGPKAYGTGKWVITKLSNSLERTDGRGNIIAAKVSVTMKSYSGR